MHIQFDAFPYEPYEIQKDFMAAVYAAIENCAIGIMESPTGLRDSQLLLLMSFAVTTNKICRNWKDSQRNM